MVSASPHLEQNGNAPDPGSVLGIRRLALGFLGLAGVTYALIVLGALVRAHGAGLSCPDWPLCFGKVIPAFDARIAFEWSHRVLAGSVGLGFLTLSALTLRKAGLRPQMGKGLLAAGLLLALQIVLGGLTVLRLLASWTVTTHLLTGNAFALALVLLGRKLWALADASGRDPSPRPEPATTSQKFAVVLAGALLFCQILLGGLVSSNYAGLACPDWPTCMNGEFFPSWRGAQGLHVLHRSFGYACFLAIVFAAWSGRNHRVVRRWLAIAALLVSAQIVVGITNVLLRLPVEITGLHSALAAGLVCCLGVAVREIARSPTPG